MADIAFNAERDKHLRAMPVGHLFGSNVTRLALKQGAYLRSYVYTLVELLSPTHESQADRAGAVGRARNLRTLIEHLANTL